MNCMYISINFYWKIVGNVVTIKRPVRPGDIVISVLATEMVE